MKRIIGLFISSLFFLSLFDSNAWASCTNASSGLGGYFCSIAGDTLCAPAAGPRQCCTLATECPAPPTSTPPPGAGPTIPPYDPECPAASGTGIKTALGCIPTDATLFVAYALPWAIGFGGGVAFLLGLYGAFLIATASGDPEKVQAGKELITSVVIGVAVIAFSVLILRTIGVDILGIF